VLGVGAGKLERFANLNARAIQPAIEEISTESRFVLTATPRKNGRRITSIEIAWSEKPQEERRSLKSEMDRHSTGRKARRSGTAETVTVAFPQAGSIAYSPRWLTLKQQAGCNMDNALIASNFRRFCRGKGLSLDAVGIEQIFSDYCNKIGVLP